MEFVDLRLLQQLSNEIVTRGSLIDLDQVRGSSFSFIRDISVQNVTAENVLRVRGQSQISVSSTTRNGRAGFRNITGVSIKIAENSVV